MTIQPPEFLQTGNIKEVDVLIDFSRDTYLKIRRGNLSKKHWSEITTSLNAAEEDVGSSKLKKQWKRKKGRSKKTFNLGKKKKF
jgi:hypothetical protein